MDSQKGSPRLLSMPPCFDFYPPNALKILPIVEPSSFFWPPNKPPSPPIISNLDDPEPPPVREFKNPAGPDFFYCPRIFRAMG